MHGYKSENYRNMKSIHHGKAVTRLRLSSHNLPVETGRYINIPRSHRICLLCHIGAKLLSYGLCVPPRIVQIALFYTGRTKNLLVNLRRFSLPVHNSKTVFRPPMAVFTSESCAQDFYKSNLISPPPSPPQWWWWGLN